MSAMWWHAWAVVGVALCVGSGCRQGNSTSPPNGGLSGSAGADAGADPDATCLETDVTEDRDGDGVPAVWRSGCGTDELYPSLGATDCDDRDPSVSRAAWADSDGDGATLREMHCLAALPPGFASLPSLRPDCDDHDPAVQDFGYVDADGDNFGAAVTCIPTLSGDSPPPHGVSRNPGDCDDSNPLVHPGAFERWHDGVDSDCNGEEDPFQCGSPADAGHVPDGCGCDLLTPEKPEIDQKCLGTELVVVKQHLCDDCLERNVLVIGNRGTLPTLSGFDLFVGDDPKPIHVPDNLASAAVSLPFAIQGSGKMLRIVEPQACSGTAASFPLQYAEQCLTP